VALLVISPDTVAINEERTKKERRKEQRRRERKQKEKSTFGGKMFIIIDCEKMNEKDIEKMYSELALKISPFGATMWQRLVW